MPPDASKLPRDGDGDGLIYDSTPDEMPEPGEKAPSAPSVSQPTSHATGPAHLRDFQDATATRAAIYDQSLRAATQVQPVSNQRHILSLHDPAYEGPDDYSLADQKKAILSGGTLGRRLKGTWRLTDTVTGKVLSEKRTTLATVPFMTPRGTFILGGNEYSLASQLRLRPGVYARVKDNGQAELHVNIMPGQGLTHRIGLEPETGRFNLEIGQAKLPLIPLLRAMGVSDQQFRDAWGQDVAYTNMLRDNPQVIDKLAAKLLRGGTTLDAPSKRAAVAAEFAKMVLDPEVTRRTLGHPYSHVTADAILAGTKKLLQVARGEAESDDRDHLAYMMVYGPEDLISERVGRDRLLLAKLLWKASRTGTIDHIPAGALNKGLQTALLGSGLGQISEAINPGMLMDQQSRISRLGVGAIPSIDSIPDSARDVQPSHMAFIDPVFTPESLAAGVDSRIARGARKGQGNRLYARFTDARSGRTVWRSPQDLVDAVVAFPGALASGKAFVPALEKGRTRFVDRRRVQYELPHFEDAFSPLTNLVPMKSGVKPQRAVMAGRMISQALPLSEPEAPLVQAAVPGNPLESFEEQLGRQMGALKSDVDGEVVKVTPDEVHVQTPQGVKKYQLYNHFALARKTYLHNTPSVAVGDRVHKGQLLARSNYTDANGATALGRNARVAYLPNGQNFEDAIVVSKSFAKKLTSTHMYQHELQKVEGTKLGRDVHASVFPGKLTAEQLQAYDDDGVIRPGTVVQPDQPLILAIKERERHHGTLHKGRQASWSDASETWDHHVPGVVTDVAHTRKGVLVTVKAENPLEIADKISGRFGDKGVISALLHDSDSDAEDDEPNDSREVMKIVPDAEMPTDKDGRPYECLMNPLGIISRVNPSQMVEASLGKIAALTGRPYKVPDFGKVPDLRAYAEDELKKHGLSATETVIDPKTGREIPNVFTGNRFIMKLHHTAASKSQGRGTAGYTADGQPARGGAHSSKLISLMDVHALLSHGSTAVIRDAGAVRGQAQPEFWARFMAGHDMPPPKTSVIHEKFLDLLRGGGLNPVRRGTKTNLLALTDQNVDQLAGDRELENAETVDWQDYQKPIRGGLFDETLTGAHGGDRWSALKLHEPLPNPAFEEPIRRLLGLTQQQFRDVLAGRREIACGKGPRALRDALAAIDIDRESEHARQEIASGKKAHRDAAVKKLGLLKAAKKFGIHPKDWILSRVPILPPRFRPVSLMQGSKLPMIADPNMLYRELYDANKGLAEMSGLVDDVGDEREAVYDAFKAVVGLGEPLHPKNRERGVRGLLKHVFGHNPKTGMVQRKLIASPTDLVGRAVIAPDPELELDQIGLPESKAWEVYQPFIVRRLVRRGMPRLQAVRAATERTEEARKAMLTEMEARPIVTNRAPTLHRYSIMAFRPTLAPGDAVRLPPLVYKGMGADNDGDAVQYHVVADDDAAREALEKMLPSRNLLSVSDFKAHQVPSQEYIAGLYSATANQNAERRPRVMATIQDVIRAYERGELHVDDPVHVIEH